MKLYEIVQQYTELFDKIDDIDQTDEQAMQDISDKFVSLWDKFEEKAENTIKYIKSLEAEAKAIKEERDRLYKKEKAVKNKIESIRDLLHYTMRSMQLDKVKTNIANVHTRTTNKVDIYDEDQIPQEYKKEKVTISIDKKAIKKMIEDWVEVHWARIIVNESISIR